MTTPTPALNLDETALLHLRQYEAERSSLASRRLHARGLLARATRLPGAQRKAAIHDAITIGETISRRLAEIDQGVAELLNPQREHAVEYARAA